MFSYYEKGYKSRKTDRIITIDDLVETIKNNPHKETIENLWDIPYRSEGYDAIKAKLPCVTPAGIFHGGRREENCIQLSEYFFFDIDLPENADVVSYKANLLDNYGSHISLLGKSVGGRGLFFYVKVNGVKIEDYKAVYEYLRTNVFGGLSIDNNAKGINRAQIIPYDTDVYYNKSINIDKPIITEDIDNYKRTFTIKKNNKESCFISNVSFIPIEEVMGMITMKTKVDVGNMLFKIDPIPYLNIYFSKKKIEDTRKHATFRGYTQALMYLNPGIELLTVQSFISYVNEVTTTKKMTTREMMRTVENEYNR